MNLTRFLPLACLILTSPLHAQQAAEATLKVDLVAWGDPIPGLALKPGAAATTTAQSFTYSETLSYSGPAILEIYQQDAARKTEARLATSDDAAHELKPLLPTPSEAGDSAAPKQAILEELAKRRKEKPGLVALARLPAAPCRHATVLLAPVGDGTFISHVIDDDPAKLPPGKLRVHNLSPHPVVIRCNGAANKTLAPRASEVFPADGGQIIYELGYQKDGEWKMQENNILPLRETEQAQMIVLRSDNRFFLSTDGSSGGYLQIVTLRRKAG